MTMKESGGRLNIEMTRGDSESITVRCFEKSGDSKTDKPFQSGDTVYLTVREDAEEAYYADPLLCPVLPQTETSLFPETGVSRILEITLDYGMDGDALMDAINSYTGFYAIASVNPDGTPNIAFFVYAMVKE